LLLGAFVSVPVLLGSQSVLGCGWVAKSWMAMNENVTLFLNLWRPSGLAMILLVSWIFVWYLVRFWLLFFSLGNGYLLMLGCVVGQSVALLNGEQPWSIAPQYEFSFPLRSLMNLSMSETSFIDFTESVNGDVRPACNWSVRHWFFPTIISVHVFVCGWTFWKPPIGSGTLLYCVAFELSALHPMYRVHICVTTDCCHFIISYSSPLFQNYGITVSLGIFSRITMAVLFPEFRWFS